MLIVIQSRNKKVIKFKRSSMPRDTFDQYRQLRTKYCAIDESNITISPIDTWFEFEKELRDLGFMIQGEKKEKSGSQQLEDCRSVDDMFEDALRESRKTVPEKYELDSLNRSRFLLTVFERVENQERIAQAQEDIAEKEFWRAERNLPLTNTGEAQ